MMTKHATQPALCSECLTMAESLAEQAQPDQLVPYICIHNFVVAMGYTQGNTIRTWNTLGPVSAAHAQAAIERMLLEAERLGMELNPTKPKQ